MSFNWEIYSILNPDLLKAGLNTKQQLERHYLVHGKKENRHINVNHVYADFDTENYKKNNIDLQHMNNQQLELHWLKHGRYENRHYKVRKLIISAHLIGGLCNQMFQIACAYVLGLKYDKKLIICTQEHNPHSNINYFNNIFKKIDINTSLKINNIFRENPDTSSIYVDIPNFNEDTIIYGYFQNYKYINEYRNEILELFKIDKPRESRLRNIYTDLQNSYFLHIRRGDYVNNIHHELNLETYYKKALDIIKQRENNKYIIYVFSNDINYCKNIEWLQHNNIKFIDGLDELDSLYLMSMCSKGAICCNSSYSWWGAYMINNKEKFVIFPNRWFSNNNIKVEIGWPGCKILNI
jgi:hypothetical protein